MIFQTDSGKKTLLVLQIKGEEIGSGVREMAKTERIAGDGVLSKVGKSLRKWFFSNNTGIEVITVSGLRGEGKVGKRS